MVKKAMIIFSGVADIDSLSEVDMIWLPDIGGNRAFVDNGLGGKRFFLFDQPSSSDEQNVTKSIELVERECSDWESIDYIGVDLSPVLVSKLIMPQGVLNGLYIVKLTSGFRLQKTPPPARPNHFESWRTNKPPKGLVTITDRALERIAELRDHLRKQEPDQDWVAALNWGSRSSRGPQDQAWCDLGPGFDLGFFPRQEIPPDVIERQRGVEIVLRLGLNFKIFAGKKIDYIPGTGFISE